MLVLAACGTKPTNDAAADVPASEQAAAQKKAPQKSTPVAATAMLPIEPGLYGRNGESCSTASDLFFYDGYSVGEIGSDGAAHWTSNRARISRIGPALKPLDPRMADAIRGFTLAWTEEGDREGFPSLALRVTGVGRFTHLSLGSFGRTDYKSCSFPQLSGRMQEAVIAEQPQFVGGEASADADDSGAAALPIDAGYYVQGMSCPNIAMTSPEELIGRLTYYDEKRILYGGPPREVLRVETLTGNRYRIHYREAGEDGRTHPDSEMLKVNSPSNFINGQGNRNMLCPSNQIPHAVRVQWGEFLR